MNIRELVEPYIEEDAWRNLWVVLPDDRRVKFYVERRDGGYDWYTASDGLFGDAETFEDACNDVLAAVVAQYWDHNVASYSRVREALGQLGYAIESAVEKHQGHVLTPCPRCGAERVIHVARKRQQMHLWIVCEVCDLAEGG